MTTQNGCTWSAASNATWVTTAGATNRIGSGRVQLTVAENTGGARTGTLAIAGQTVTVNQEKRPCVYAIDPSAYNPPFSGGTVSVAVTTTAGCDWTVTGNPAWVSANPTKLTGSGTTTLTVQPNSGAARNATLLIAGQTFSVNQESRPACAYTISPSSYSPSSSGGNIAVTVTTTADCEWTVTGNPSWISANPTGRSGTGTTAVTVQSNSGATRSATFKIAGRDFAVQQSSAPCTYSAGPTTRSVPYTKQTREIGVVTQSHCPVTVSESASWIEIVSAPTFGSGEIVIRIEENRSEDKRSAAIRITGENWVHTTTVIQDGKD